jgi:hypothetical protein
MIWQFEEMGYDISIEENGRTGRKPIKWDYLDVPQRKQLHDTYAKLIALRMDEPEMFSSTATLQWKVSDSDWENGRFLTLSDANGTKHMIVIGNFTNTAISATTSFPKTGMWYNYMDSSETLEVTSTTMTIDVPANHFKMYTTFQPR